MSIVASIGCDSGCWSVSPADREWWADWRTDEITGLEARYHHVQQHRLLTDLGRYWLNCHLNDEGQDSSVDDGSPAAAQWWHSPHPQDDHAPQRTRLPKWTLWYVSGNVMECCLSSSGFNPAEHFRISSGVLSDHQWMATTPVAKLRQSPADGRDARGPEGACDQHEEKEVPPHLLLKLHILFNDKTNVCFCGSNSWVVE